METILAINLIATNPAVRSGRPYIVGTTLTVADIAIAKVFGMMEADAIADYYDISLPQVYAALAYYYDHKDEIDATIQDRRRLADAMRGRSVLEAAIHLYLDENISPKVAVQLRKRGVNATSVHEIGLTGDSDINHLTRAASLQQVLVTCDTDFLVLASTGVEHCGIVFGVQEEMSIGAWVKELELLCKVCRIEDMRNHIEYI